MYTVTTEVSFDAAHFLAGYQGKCRNIHGHRWRVLAEVKSELLAEDGMVTDFADLKEALHALAEQLDHCLIIEAGTMKAALLQALKEESFRIVELPFRPTAEQFAKYFYERMQAEGYEVSKIIVYETPNNCASYSE